MACVYEQRTFTIIEREPEYVAIGVRRVRAVTPLFADADELRVQHVGAAHAPLDAHGDAPSASRVPDSASKEA